MWNLPSGRARSGGWAVYWLAFEKLGGVPRGNRFAELGPAAGLGLETVANVRVHGETQGRPEDRRPEERAALLPLNRWPAQRCRAVSIETNRYSVPTKFAGGLLTARIEGAQVRFFADRTLAPIHSPSSPAITSSTCSTNALGPCRKPGPSTLPEPTRWPRWNSNCVTRI